MLIKTVHRYTEGDVVSSARETVYSFALQRG